MNHPVVGELRLHREKLPVDGMFLVLYYPDQDSESDEKLRVLSSLNQTPLTSTRDGSQTAELGSHLERHSDR